MGKEHERDVETQRIGEMFVSSMEKWVNNEESRSMRDGAHMSVKNKSQQNRKTN